jgi:hypothetical protein
VALDAFNDCGMQLVQQADKFMETHPHLREATINVIERYHRRLENDLRKAHGLPEKDES